MLSYIHRRPVLSDALVLQIRKLIHDICVNTLKLNRDMTGIIPRLAVCLCMRMSSLQYYAKVHVKSIFICPGSIAGVPFDSAGRFWATLLLRTTCTRVCCNGWASCVTA